MFSTLFSATLLSAIAIQGAFAEFTINTISLTQCSSAHVTWSEATAPYNLAVVPVDDPCNTIVADLGDHNGLSMTWHNVTLAAGTKVMFSLLDANDNEAWSGEMTVADGDSSCLSTASSAVSSEVSSATSSVASEASSLASDVASASATTLLLTSTYARSASSASVTETATIVGAANAGLVGNSASSGAFANVQMPMAATIASGLIATVAMLVL
ncbi:hypothetical protein PNOK_0815000 [Pyrrhoderma noxium]|uniref:Uncharacterized protein n=1 Tax=Pyrrhoderma noxium TaxID=2282107 RepID=A0A286UAD9_9AGAM|nr:hypothetical protein PNOK_0815000 [Pyrrhoderma noxium]